MDFITTSQSFLTKGFIGYPSILHKLIENKKFGILVESVVEVEKEMFNYFEKVEIPHGNYELIEFKNLNDYNKKIIVLDPFALKFIPQNYQGEITGFIGGPSHFSFNDQIKELKAKNVKKVISEYLLEELSNFINEENYEYIQNIITYLPPLIETNDNSPKNTNLQIFASNFYYDKTNNNLLKISKKAGLNIEILENIRINDSEFKNKISLNTFSTVDYPQLTSYIQLLFSDFKYNVNICKSYSINRQFFINHFVKLSDSENNESGKSFRSQMLDIINTKSSVLKTENNIFFSKEYMTRISCSLLNDASENKEFDQYSSLMKFSGRTRELIESFYLIKPDRKKSICLRPILDSVCFRQAIRFAKSLESFELFPRITCELILKNKTNAFNIMDFKTLHDFKKVNLESILKIIEKEYLDKQTFINFFNFSYFLFCIETDVTRRDSLQAILLTINKITEKKHGFSKNLLFSNMIKIQPDVDKIDLKVDEKFIIYFWKNHFHEIFFKPLNPKLIMIMSAIFQKENSIEILNDGMKFLYHIFKPEKEIEELLEISYIEKSNISLLYILIFRKFLNHENNFTDKVDFERIPFESSSKVISNLHILLAVVYGKKELFCSCLNSFRSSNFKFTPEHTEDPMDAIILLYVSQIVKDIHFKNLANILCALHFPFQSEDLIIPSAVSFEVHPSELNFTLTEII